MSHPHQNDTAPLQGTKPEWLNLRKRPCDNCGSRYKPLRPNSRFCQPSCKTAFHRNGGAFQKLRETIDKEIKKRMNLTERCPTCKGKCFVIGKATQRGQRLKCPNADCIGGEQLTNYGQELIAALRRFLFTPSWKADLAAMSKPANAA